MRAWGGVDGGGVSLEQERDRRVISVRRMCFIFWRPCLLIFRRLRGGKGSAYFLIVFSLLFFIEVFVVIVFLEFML